MAERRSEKNLFFPPRRFDTFESRSTRTLATYHFRAHNPIPVPSHLTTFPRRIFNRVNETAGKNGSDSSVHLPHIF